MWKYLRDNQIVWVVAALLVIFITGYFLRSYYQINFALDASPYEAFELRADGLSDFWSYQHFTDKLTKYPTKFFFKMISDHLFGDFYIIFLLGFIGIFLLGWEVTQKIWGGVLATIPYAIASENLMAYTKNIGINDSGLSYVLIYWILWSLLRFTCTKKNYYLAGLVIASLIVMTSYHTAATAIATIFFGLLVAFWFARLLSFKLGLTLGGLIFFHLCWLVLFDVTPLQISLINSALVSWQALFATIALVGGWLFYRYFRPFVDHFWHASLPLLTIMVASGLLIYQINWLHPFFAPGTQHIFISAPTLNALFAQVIILHLYLLTLLPPLKQQTPTALNVVLCGWFLGISIITIGLIGQGYIGRVFDYSFPLTFILFAHYWVGVKKFRPIVVGVTCLILIISQFIIFNDPYSQRRYYRAEEMAAVKNIISLNLTGIIMSDLRTAALFRYFSDERIQFFEANEEPHQKLFYRYRQLQRAETDTYVILTNAMRSVVYANNFPTEPVTESITNYYDKNFKKIYDDGVMKVYNLNTY